jgi:hypothetical protein
MAGGGAAGEPEPRRVAAERGMGERVAVDGGIGEGRDRARRHDVFGEHPSERGVERHVLDAGHGLQPLVQQLQRVRVAQPVAVVQEAVVEEAALVHGWASPSLAVMKSAISARRRG